MIFRQVPAYPRHPWFPFLDLGSMRREVERAFRARFEARLRSYHLSAWKREWKAGIFVAGKWKRGSGRETGLRYGLTQRVSERNAEKSFVPIFLPKFFCLPFPDLGSELTGLFRCGLPRQNSSRLQSVIPWQTLLPTEVGNCFVAARPRPVITPATKQMAVCS